MEYFELRNKLFFPVRRKLINDYQMGTLDFERCEQLVNDLILKIGQYMDTGVWRLYLRNFKTRFRNCGH